MYINAILMFFLTIFRRGENILNNYIIGEANRCLQCKKPMCSMGCPIATPIKEAIALLLDSKISEAGAMLFENNPLSLICAYVCPQENQCEGHCVLGKKGSPIYISGIEKYISDFYFNLNKPQPSTKASGKVAVVGAGPAGLTMALILAQKNYDVTIFESNRKIGGILRYGIPEFRLPRTSLDKFEKLIRDLGISIRPNVTIGLTLTIDELMRDGYQAIFLGTGVWSPQKLGTKGESLGNVHYSIEYLRNPEVYHLGKKLAIIGGGNVAMDVARTAFRHGCEEVYVVYHKDEEEMPARKVEKEFALFDGTTFVWNRAVKEFVQEGLILRKTRKYTGEDGKVRVNVVEGSEELFKVDSTIIAIGQTARAPETMREMGIELERRSLVKVDQEGRTNRKGVFASGDITTGAKTVVEAVQRSKHVAESIDRYMQGLEI